MERRGGGEARRGVSAQGKGASERNTEGLGKNCSPRCFDTRFERKGPTKQGEGNRSAVGQRVYKKGQARRQGEVEEERRGEKERRMYAPSRQRETRKKVLRGIEPLGFEGRLVELCDREPFRRALRRDLSTAFRNPAVV